MSLNPVLSVDDLPGFASSYTRDGDRVQVLRESAPYVFRRTGNFVPDGRLVIPALWVRGVWVHEAYQCCGQSEWHINAEKGNDGNDGATSLTALKTHAALQRKLRARWDVRRVIDVFLESDLGVEDPLVSDSYVAGAGLLRYRGSLTTDYEGSFTDVVTRVPGTTTYSTVTDTALELAAWSSYGIGRRIRIVDGPRAGAIAWFIKDGAPGSKSTRTTPFFIPTIAQPVPFTFAEVFPQVGDPFVIETMVNVKTYNFEMRHEPSTISNSGNVYMVVRDIDFEGANNTAGYVNCVNGGGQFQGCNLDSFTVASGAATAVACRLSNSSLIGGALLAAYGCWHHGATDTAVNSGTTLIVDFGGIAQGTRLCRARRGGAVLIGDAQLADSPDDGLVIDVDGTCKVAVQNSGTVALGGGNNAGRGVRCNGRMWYDPAHPPTVTGTVADARVGGVDKSWSSIAAAGGYMDAKNGALVAPVPT